MDWIKTPTSIANDPCFNYNLQEKLIKDGKLNQPYFQSLIITNHPHPRGSLPKRELFWCRKRASSVVLNWNRYHYHYYCQWHRRNWNFFSLFLSTKHSKAHFHTRWWSSMIAPSISQASKLQFSSVEEYHDEQ